MKLYCHANRKEKIRLDFRPCINTGENITWEEWNVAEPLVIFATDYDMLLPYFKEVFPLKDPTNGETQKSFDLCCHNWIGRDDWRHIIEHIKSDIVSKENGDEKRFFNQFVDWIESQLSWADIIMVEGNL